MDNENGDIDNDDESFDSIEWIIHHVIDRDLPRARANDPEVTRLSFSGGDTVNNLNNEQWEQIGRDLSNNTHLDRLEFPGVDDVMDEDGHKVASLFRGLTKSTSISSLHSYNNGWSSTVLKCMMPFLQNASNLQMIELVFNNVNSERFNLLLRALRDSPIEEIYCYECGIDSDIDIDPNNCPKKLKELYLYGNNINTDGCHEVAKLLQREDTVLARLDLTGNNIGDEGVSILVDALQSNAILEQLQVRDNGVSQKGQVMLLQLVNDISSVEATLRSNHTLTSISVDEEKYTTQHIEIATGINEANRGDAEAAGREKIIQTQLNSAVRAQIAELQDVIHTLYSEINPLHLSEVLSLVSKHHGIGELYAALKLSIGAVISMIDTKQCVKQCYTDRATKLEKLREYEQKTHMVAHDEGRSEEMNTSLTVIDAAEGGSKVGSESDGSSPRKRSHLADDSATLEEQSSEHEPQLADCMEDQKR